MHGQNELRPFESTANGWRLQVHDVWYTIQGEGPFYGTPAAFVRLTGCNLACSFCDTFWDDKKDKYELVSTIADRVLKVLRLEPGLMVSDLVVLTGGEPCRQDLAKFIQCMCDNLGFRVQIETAGTYWQPCFLNPKVTLVCSPKTKHVHPKIKEHCKHWKYVIQANHVSIYDGLPAGHTQFIPLSLVKATIAPDLFNDLEKVNPAMLEQGGLYTMVTGGTKYGNPCRPPEGATVWLSPCDEGSEGDEPERTQNNIRLVGRLCMKYGYRAQVQMHKIMDLP